ncbi:MAG: c-type cytochrome [Gemmataceae bacterium]
MGTNAQQKMGLVAGWDIRDGELLVNELNCVACHKADDAITARMLPRKSPNLQEVGRRITPQYLQAYLADPHVMKPGTLMPHVLHAHSDAEHEKIVDLLAHYLSSLGGPCDQSNGGASEYQIDQGKALFHKVGCVACHQPMTKVPERKLNLPPGVKRPKRKGIRETKSVSLGNLAMKTTMAQLEQFLLDPLHARPSGRMPAMRLKVGEARAIAAYLLRDQLDKRKRGLGVGLEYAYYPGYFNRVPNFDKLKPIQSGKVKSFAPRKIKLKKFGKFPRVMFAVRFQGFLTVPKAGDYRFWVKSDDGSVLRIGNKVVVDNDGVHSPKEESGMIRLEKGSVPIELGFTQGGGGYELNVDWQPPDGRRGAIPPGLLQSGAYAMIPKGRFDFRVDPTKAKAGRKLFASLGCASCHQADNKAAELAKTNLYTPLAKLNVGAEGGCLSRQVAKGRPLYAFNAAQRGAIKKAVVNLQGELKPLTVVQKVHRTMTTFNCYSCHRRGELGGPDDSREPYFTNIGKADLGEEGRMPPGLDLVGAKLTDAGFAEYMYGGPRVRYYMSTRMPLFGKDNIGHLPELFKKADSELLRRPVGGKPAKKRVEIKPRKYVFNSKLVGVGRRFVGIKKGMSCIACHSWGPLKAEGVEGLDLLRVPGRLQPGWYHAWMLDPQKLRPGTKMPTMWPNGISQFPDVLDGDADMQINAIWAYLSVGTKGGIPAGLAPTDEYILTPVSEPIVFRTFIQGVGAHAIAVGYPQRTHIVFDALRIRLAKAWTGGFLDARPAWSGRAGQYAKLLGEDILTFPDGPQFAKLENKASPWPSIDEKRKNNPKGWHFRGYCLGKDRYPTFRYTFEGVEIEELPRSGYSLKGNYLKRTFELQSDKGVSKLYFRAATAPRITKNGEYYQTDSGAKFRIGSTTTPIIRNSEGGKELLVPIKLNNERPTKLEVEVLW